MATTLQDQYNARQNESAAQINNLYDKQNEAQANKLRSQFETNLSNKQAELNKIGPQYQTQANTLAANYERRRRNANLGAMTSGLASGTAQQQQMTLANQYGTNYGALRGQEAEAINQGNQDIANLRTAYNNALVDARAETDAKRDQELIKNFNTNRDWYDAQAANLTDYGNFDAYKNLYGEAQANQMRNVWINQHPEVAFQTGMISADDYRKLTGKAANSGYRSIYQ